MRGAAAIALVIIGGLLARVLVLDARDARRDPATYELVHHVPVAKYIQRNYSLALAGIAALFIGALYFIDRARRRIWGAVAVWVLFGAVLAAVIAYSRWAAAGFDH